MATQEQLDLRRKWVEALRSGKYQQGKGALRNSDNRYCCLGVLCDIVGVPSELPEDSDHYIFTTKDNGKISGYLNPEIAAMVGLKSVVGGGTSGMSLAGMNDRSTPFTEIADVIENNSTGIFVD
jgi:hypothetical protein